MRSFFAMIASLFKKLIAFFSREETVDTPDPDLPVNPAPGEVICYYGCPNSSRAKKLQLNKKSI